MDDMSSDPDDRRGESLGAPLIREAKEAGDVALPTASERLLPAMPEEHRQVMPSRLRRSSTPRRTSQQAG